MKYQITTNSQKTAKALSLIAATDQFNSRVVF